MKACRRQVLKLQKFGCITCLQYISIKTSKLVTWMISYILFTLLSAAIILTSDFSLKMLIAHLYDVWLYEFLQPTMSATSKEQNATSNMLFVGNLSYSVEKDDLYVLFLAKIFTYIFSACVFFLPWHLGKIYLKIVEKLSIFDLL